MLEISKVALTIRHDCCLEYIDIEFGDGTHDHLYQGLIGYCCRDHSNNELKQIWKMCNLQITSTDPDDIPPVYYNMLKELFIEMKKRNIAFDDDILESGLPVWFKR